MKLRIALSDEQRTAIAASHGDSFFEAHLAPNGDLVVVVTKQPDKKDDTPINHYLPISAESYTQLKRVRKVFRSNLYKGIGRTMDMADVLEKVIDDHPAGHLSQ